VGDVPENRTSAAPDPAPIRAPRVGAPPEPTAAERLDAANLRDEIARSRDLVATARDRAAAARDLAMAQDDSADARAAGRPDFGVEILLRAAEQRQRAAAFRVLAAQQRALAAADRAAAAADRQRAAIERAQALADRQALARATVGPAAGGSPGPGVAIDDARRTRGAAD
jgi:hypothetical protein